MKRVLSIVASVIFIPSLILGIALQPSAEAVVYGMNSVFNNDLSGISTGGTVSHISEDGNVVVWATGSHNVISGDPYSSSTTTVLYHRNVQTGATSYVTVDTTGAPVHVDEQYFAISRTGRFVAFSSSNTNIVASPTVPSSPSQLHVYLRDMLLGTTTLVDQTSSGTLANIGGGTGSPFATAVSDDGRYVTFGSQATNLLSSGNPSSPNYTRHYYIKDMATGQVINPLVSNSGLRANKPTGPLATSCDGSIGVFSSSATNLTPNDNGKDNVYLVDMRNGFRITNLTYGANQGANSISISCNGRYITMYSFSTNLTADTVSGTKYHLFRYDRLTNTYSLIDKSTSGYISTTHYPEWSNWAPFNNVSDNGLVVFISSDHNMVSPAALRDYEVYLRNPEAGTTELVGINSSGVEQNPGMNHTLYTLEINAAGNSVIYVSRATNLVPGVTYTGEKLVLSKVN